MERCNRLFWSNGSKIPKSYGYMSSIRAFRLGRVDAPLTFFSHLIFNGAVAQTFLSPEGNSKLEGFLQPKVTSGGVERKTHSSGLDKREQLTHVSGGGGGWINFFKFSYFLPPR